MPTNPGERRRHGLAGAEGTQARLCLIQFGIFRSNRGWVAANKRTHSLLLVSTPGGCQGLMTLWFYPYRVGYYLPLTALLFTRRRWQVVARLSRLLLTYMINGFDLFAFIPVG